MLYPVVSIIFPNYNGGNEPLECLSSIFHLNYPRNCLEVVVIDNNSTDGSDKRIKQGFPRVNLIKLTKNLGFTKAVNMGIKKANGQYFFVANDDLVFEKNSLKILIYYLLKHPNVGIIGGKIYSKSRPNQISSCGYQMNLWTGHIFPSPEPDRIKQPDWIQGCAMLISKKVFDQIGLFDEQFQHFFEDYDLCLRTKRSGFKVKYLPSASFWHGESITANKNKPKKYYYWYKSKFRFILKNLPLLNTISILLKQLIFIATIST